MKTITDTEWERETDRRGRNYTDAPIGFHSAPKRDRDAKLSALWTPERTLRMFRRTMTSGTSHREVDDGKR